jgi:hypothetical protein
MLVVMAPLLAPAAQGRGVVCVMRMLVPLAIAVACAASCTDACEPRKMAPASVAPGVPLEMMSVHVTSSERRCSTDADCVVVTEDCCGCAALGRQTGVRADQVARLNERRGPVCAQTLCESAMSDDPTCRATRAVCRSGLCAADVPAALAPAPIATEPIPPG